MKLRGWLLLIVIAAVIAVASWHVFHEAGIVASVAVCAVYIALLSANLPIDHWMRLDSVRATIERGTDAIVTRERCPCQGELAEPHVHFRDVINQTQSERLVRAYGAAKLGDKLLKDIRHEWEKGVGLCVVLLVVWGVFAFARADATPIDPTGVGAKVVPTFDWLKAGITGLIGFFKLASSAEFLHWFRKQNGQI